MFELTAAHRVGPGESPLFVSEQLAFQERVVEGGAVYRDDRSAGGSGFEVDRARDQFLARSPFADDQKRPRHLGHAPDLV